MNYFTDIRSFAQLKKEFRRLAMQHHPDKGGDTAVMQDIVLQFEKLYDRWKNALTPEADPTGYAGDYAGATSGEYTRHVYNEYRWCGSRYNGQGPKEIADLLRTWLKETYPRCRFSVTRKNYNSIYVYLITADFPAFRNGSECTHHKDVNHYHIEKDNDLTDRAKEVLQNVCDYLMSYNYDDSDAMTDYFHTNFYLNMGVGTYEKEFKTVMPQLKASKGDQPKVFRHPEGARHKAIRQALAGCRFAEFESRRYGKILVLGSDYTSGKGEKIFYPKNYSSAKQAQGRLARLTGAGMDCKLLGYNGGYIQFLGYDPETEQSLDRERQEYTDAYRTWHRKKRTTGCGSGINSVNLK